MEYFNFCKFSIDAYFLIVKYVASVDKETSFSGNLLFLIFKYTL